MTEYTRTPASTAYAPLSAATPSSADTTTTIHRAAPGTPVGRTAYGRGFFNSDKTEAPRPDKGDTECRKKDQAWPQDTPDLRFRTPAAHRMPRLASVAYPMPNRREASRASQPEKSSIRG